jgi:hypothetical protein
MANAEVAAAGQLKMRQACYLQSEICTLFLKTRNPQPVTRNS